MLIREVIELFLHHRKHKLNASAETLKTYKYALRHFSEFMEQRDKINYQDISRVDIVSLIEHMRTELDAARWSRSRYLLIVKTLKALFHWMETDDDCRDESLRSWRERMPKGGKVPKRDYIPSADDLKKWQKAFKTSSMTGLRDHTMFSVLIETGMRRGELVSLETEHVQLDRLLIYIPSGKTGARVVNISKNLADRLKLYMRKKEKSYMAESKFLFPSRRNLAEAQDPQYVSKIFLKLKKRLNLPKLTPHTLRHAFSTYYLINGGSVEGLRAQTGHTTYDSMLHYMHLAKVAGNHRAVEMEKASPLRMLEKAG